MDALASKLLHAQRQAESDRGEQALLALQRLVSAHPSSPQVAGAMAYVLIKLKREEQALYYARRAVELAPPPGEARSMCNLALLVARSRKPGSMDEAFALFERALSLNPADPNARIGLTNILMERKQWARAEQVCREGLAHALHDQLILTHAASLVALGRLRESMELLARGTHAFPDHLRIRSGLASTSIYLSQARPAEIARLFREYGAVQERLTPRLPERPLTSADADRKVRVGVLSPDLRTHSVAFFIEPLFEHHDRDRMELAAYMCSHDEDATSERLRGRCTIWRNAASMSDEELAARVRADGIDILLDLAGHTQGHRLGVLARRPAPLQVTYLGFPDTTGLRSVDWRIVDSLTDPRGPVGSIGGDPQPTFDDRVSERLWRLDPCFLCYRPREGAPVPSRAARSGPVFGSFNAARKVSAECVELWSSLLLRVEGATLVLKGVEFADPEGSRTLARAFEQRGITDRVRFLPPNDSMNDHLASYNMIDVALDTFPYHGTTTTCEALLMGVPVVTLAGDRHAARVGVSLLTILGAREWIARTPAEYTEVAASLAADGARLDRIRAELRPRLLSSLLCDQRAFAARMVGALTAMWRERCGAS